LRTQTFSILKAIPAVPSAASSAPQPEFLFPIRVYYEDTDAGGVVYYANYLKFFERARTEWLRSLGFEQNALAASSGCIFVVRGLEMQYRKPARLDDALTIRSKVSRVGKASMDFSQICERNGELLASGQVQVGCVSVATMRPCAMPTGLSSALAPLESLVTVA
jgi:acyl-CoA thioester hydrolase